jgi:hypothetical protein
MRTMFSILVFDNYLNATLNLEHVESLDHLSLEVHNVRFDRVNNVYLQFEFGEGNTQRTICFKSEKKTTQGKGKRSESIAGSKNQGYEFLPISCKYLQKYKRMTSTNTSVITVKCGNLNRFTMRDAVGSN